MSHSWARLRCSVIVFYDDSVLLLRRPRRGDWALPGGTPRPGEHVLACARRELREETGLLIDPGRCVFVIESMPPDGERLLDLVFLSPGRPAGQPCSSEDGLHAELVALSQVRSLRLHPPVGDHLMSLRRVGASGGAQYLRHEWDATIVTRY
jgi:8-oxo-dGTP diphosphatase